MVQEQAAIIEEHTYPLSYVVITPVRNEAVFLEETLRSVVEQTVKPVEWIIVDDGSTDETATIVVYYATQHPWIRLVSRPDRGFRQRGPRVVDAFYEGLQQLTHDDYDVVVKLDGDVSFESTYFEELLCEFMQNPLLGIASGEVYEFDGQQWVTDKQKSLNPCTRGPSKVYRRTCFDAIGGLQRSFGWDGIDDWKAQMLGWQTITYEHLRVLHHRPMGAGTGSCKSRIEQGEGAYCMGYHPLYLIARGIRRMADRPYFIGGLLMIWGYVSSWLTGHERINDPELIRYLRRTQLKLLIPCVWSWHLRSNQNSSLNAAQ